MVFATITRQAGPSATIARQAGPSATIARTTDPRIYLANTTDLVAHYQFDTGSGQTLTDRTGNGHDGTLGSTTGSDTNDPSWVTEGLLFDGIDDYIDMPTSLGMALRSLAAFQVEFTIQAFSPATDAYLLHIDSLLDIRLNSSNLIRFGLVTGSYTILNSSTALTAGNWYHVQCWYDGTNYGIDLNGANDSSGAKSGSTNSTSGNARIGATTSGSAFWDERIGYSLFYNVSLTSDERNQNYRAVRDVMDDRGVTV